MSRPELKLQERDAFKRPRLALCGKEERVYALNTLRFAGKKLTYIYHLKILPPPDLSSKRKERDAFTRPFPRTQ